MLLILNIKVLQTKIYRSVKQSAVQMILLYLCKNVGFWFVWLFKHGFDGTKMMQSPD